MPPSPESTAEVVLGAAKMPTIELTAEEILVDGKVYSSEGLAAFHPGI